MAKFMVNYTFKGRATRLIDAESREAAEAKIEAEIDRDDFDIDADDIDDIDFDVKETHPVTRAGLEIWTTYVWKEDVRGHQSALQATPLFSGVAA